MITELEINKLISDQLAKGRALTNSKIVILTDKINNLQTVIDTYNVETLSEQFDTLQAEVKELNNQIKTYQAALEELGKIQLDYLERAKVNAEKVEELKSEIVKLSIDKKAKTKKESDKISQELEDAIVGKVLQRILEL